MPPILPEASIEFLEGGLGVAAPAAGLIALLGISSQGDANEPIFIGNDSLIPDLLGVGPLAAAAAFHLRQTGQPLLAVPLTSSVAGSTGSVSHTGDGATVLSTSGNSAVTRTGTGTSTASLSGTATVFVDLVVEVLENGADLASTPSLRISTDGGDTFGDPFDLDASGVKAITGTGLTITFAEGTFVDGDLYTARAAFSNPIDDAEVVITITAEADALADLTAAFTYSLDGGDTTSEEIAVPLSGVYEIPDSGICIKFTDASFVVGDTYTFSAVAKGFNLTNVTSGVDALLEHAQIGEVEYLHLIGKSDATIAAGLATLLEDAEIDHLYLWGLCSVRDNNAGEDNTTYAAAQVTAFANVESARLVVCSGYEEVQEVLTSEIRRRPVAWSLAARLGSISISTNPIRVDDGKLPRVSAIYHDIRLFTNLDTAGFVGARTYQGRAGFYLSRAQTFAAADSDYKSIMNRRVADAAARVLRNTTLSLVGSSVKVNGETGKILPTEAKRIEGLCNQALQATIGTECSGVSSLVDRDENILSTKKLKIKALIVPFGYAEQIEVSLGFSNPALEVV